MAETEITYCENCKYRVAVFNGERFVCPITDVCTDGFYCAHGEEK